MTLEEAIRRRDELESEIERLDWQEWNDKYLPKEEQAYRHRCHEELKDVLATLEAELSEC